MSDIYDLSMRFRNESSAIAQIDDIPHLAKAKKEKEDRESSGGAIVTAAQAMRDGLSSRVVEHLGKGPNAEENIQRWHAALLYSQEFGLTPDIAFNMVDELTEQYFMGKPAPKTLPKQIKDSFNAAMLSNKVGTLVSKSMGHRGMFDFLGDAFPHLQESAEQRKAYYDKAMELWQEMEKLNIDVTPRNWFNTLAKDIAGVLPYTGDVVLHGAAAGVATLFMSSGVGSMTWLPAVRAFIGSTTRFARSSQIMRGLNKIEMVQRGIPDEDSDFWSNIGALGGAAIEGFLGIQTGISAGLGIPGIRGVTERIITRLGVTNLFALPAAKFAGRMILDTVGEMGEEALDEVWNGFTTIIAQELQAAGVVTDPYTLHDMAQGAGQAAWLAARTSWFMSIGGNVAHLVRDHKTLEKLAKAAPHMEKDDFIKAAVSSGVFGEQLNETRQAEEFGNMWDLVTTDQMSKAARNSEIVQAKARTGKPGENVERDSAGRINVQPIQSSLNEDGSQRVTILAGDATSGKNIYGEIHVDISENTVTIVGGEIEADYITSSAEIIASIAAMNPGKQILLGDGATDPAILGGFAQLTEERTDRPFRVGTTPEDAQAENIVRNRLKAIGVADQNMAPAVALLKSLATPGGQGFLKFVEGLNFERMEKQDADGNFVIGEFTANKNPVNGAMALTDALIKIAENLPAEKELIVLNHEMAHYFRSFMSTYAPNDPGLLALNKKYGITDRKWTAAQEEQFVADYQEYLSGRFTPDGETASIFERLGEFFRAMFDVIKSSLSPETVAVFEGWFGRDAIESVDEAGQIQVTPGQEGTYKASFVHPDIIKPDTTLQDAIANAVMIQGRKPEYYENLQKKFGEKAAEFAEGLEGEIEESYRKMIFDGTWVTDPWLVASVKQFAGFKLTPAESDLLDFEPPLRSIVEGGIETDPEKIQQITERGLYMIEPPQAQSKGKAFKEWYDGMDQRAKDTFDMFSSIIAAGKDKTIQVDRARYTDKEKTIKEWYKADVSLLTAFVEIEQWNKGLSENPEARAAVLEIMKLIPEPVRMGMRLNADGTMNETDFDKEFKISTSFMQRVLDNLENDRVPAHLVMPGGRKIKLDKTKKELLVNGGEAYRRAVLQAKRDAFMAGTLRKVKVGSLTKDNWGAMGFLATNSKTIASGDFTTICPQMFFNKGCFYCYRRASLESGVNVKLAAERIWYTGEILEIADSEIDILNRIGGLRIQSFGDWMGERDRAQFVDMILDAEARGLQIKIITKEAAMVEFVGFLKEQGIGNSIFMNISADHLMEEPGPGDKLWTPLNHERPFVRREDGQALWKRAQSVKEATKLVKKHQFANIRTVVTDDAQLIADLKDPNVKVITGYHGNIRTPSLFIVNSETGATIQEFQPLGDSGMPALVPGKYEFVKDAKGNYLDAKGKKVGGVWTEVVKKIDSEGLVQEYAQKMCCVTGKCATCRTLCGAPDRAKQALNGEISFPVAQEYISLKSVVPYSSAPDTLMGMTNRQKGYTDYKYRHEITVKVTLDNGESFIDGMNGLNLPHALERAKRNWPDAQVDLVSDSPDTGLDTVTVPLRSVVPAFEMAFNSAKEKFSTTTDMNEAGFILPDGSMLDFSGNSRNPDYYKKGQRGLDHVQIEWDGMDTNTPIKSFLQMGAVRIDAQAGLVETWTEPTPVQLQMIKELIERNPSTTVDLNSEDGRNTFIDGDIKASRTIGYIRRFYSGEDIGENILYSIVPNDDKPKTDPNVNRKYSFDAAKYKTLEEWLAATFDNPEQLTDADRAYLQARFDHAHSDPKAKRKFNKPGEFTKHLASGSNLISLISEMAKVIYSKRKFLNAETIQKADRLEGAIARTPVLKKAVEVWNKDKKKPTAAETKAILSAVRSNEALYKYLKAIVDADQELAHEALDDIRKVPELLKRDITGNEVLSINDQKLILAALKGTELEKKLADGSITISEARNFVGVAKGMFDLQEQMAKETGKKLEKLKADFEARNAARKLAVQMQRMKDFIMRPPSARVNYFHATLVKAIQEAIRKGAPLDASALAMAKSYAAQSNPEWGKVMEAFAKNLAEMTKNGEDKLTLDNLQTIAFQVKDLLDKGRESKRNQELVFGEMAKMNRANILAELRAGKYFKESVMPGSDEEKKRVKQLSREALLFDADRPDAFFRKYLGKEAARILYDESIVVRTKKLQNYDRRTKAVIDFIAKNHMMGKDQLTRKLVIKGIWGSDENGLGGQDVTITGSEMVGIRALVGREGSAFNQYQRDAFIYGNLFSPLEKDSDGSIGDQDETAMKANKYMEARYQNKVQTILAFLDENMSAEEEQLADLMIATMDNDADWFRFAKAMVSLTNEEPHKEQFYFPIYRVGGFESGEDNVADKMAEMGLKTALDQSMAIQRKSMDPRSQKKVKIDALEIFFHSIARQEHLTEVGPYIQILRGIFLNGQFSSTLRQSVIDSIGQQGWDYLTKQIDTLTNPSEFSEKASGAEALNFWRGTVVVSNLAFRWSSVMMQALTSPLPGFVEAPAEMAVVAAEAMIDPLKFHRKVEDKVAVDGVTPLGTWLKHRQLTEETKILNKRKELGFSTTMENISIIGMKGLEWADRHSVAIVWEAVFRKQMRLSQDSKQTVLDREIEAGRYADRFITQTQPTAEEADRAPMYRNPNVFKALILQFTQPLNVIWNNIRNDLPQAAKEQQYGRIMGFITAYALSGLAIGLTAVARGRGPDDDDDGEAWARFWIHASTSQFTDSIPFIGQYVSGLTGYMITGDNNSWIRRGVDLAAFDLWAKSLEEVTKGFHGGDVQLQKVIINSLKGFGMMNGVPVRAIEEYTSLVMKGFGQE